MILPLQNGHTFGRVTSSADCEFVHAVFSVLWGARGLPEAGRQSSRVDDCLSVCMTHIARFLPLRLFKNEQSSPVATPRIG